MKLEQEQVIELRRLFLKANTKEDLLKVINKSIKYQNNGTKEFKYISLKTLTYYANANVCKDRYTSFEILKKSGSKRTIHSPHLILNKILKALNLILQCSFEPHQAAMGFVKNRSIVDNAKYHLNHSYVYNIDLKDYFYCFDLKRVKFGFFNVPFDFSKNQESLAFFIACLCTHPLDINGELKTVLPQGAATSPTLTNILSYRLDRKLTGLAKRFNLLYSRYADDITFSGDFDFSKNKDFIAELDRIITKEGFEINKDKTRMQSKAFRQQITGLVVNEKVNVHKGFIKQLRMWIHYIEKYGLEKAQSIFDKSEIKPLNAKYDLANVLKGKIEFLKHVKGQEDPTYIKLNQRLRACLIKAGRIEENLTEKKSSEDIKFEKAISLLIKQGDIESAMNLFFK
ncbi:reverse transcriptase family protein [Myroides profundi]|uniref:RNA-directed DNA polymerase n=1 Tax=Myroides profundi TaxID=480520 RepID=A0AAJ4W4G8_MYRPR|nr:reverse transcriptase family protein [Myroides profundi]AJH14522.1 RNA-directed DNA polymerase [Myroides profundi]SEQ93908.1 Reverse transcriptase (RNA-dependent DNA polymerase) [Myroides profundi]